MKSKHSTLIMVCLGGILLVGWIFVALTLLDTEGTDSSTTSPQATTPSSQIIVINHEEECENWNVSEEWWCTVSGTIENTGADTEWITVSVQWYDGDGIRIGDSSDIIFDVRANQKATFETIGDWFDRKPVRYEIETDCYP